MGTIEAFLILAGVAMSMVAFGVQTNKSDYDRGFALGLMVGAVGFWLFAGFIWIFTFDWSTTIAVTH